MLTAEQVDLAIDADLLSRTPTRTCVARAKRRGVDRSRHRHADRGAGGVGRGPDHAEVLPGRQLREAGTLQSFAAVFSDARFVPTGGVSIGNLADYLSLPNVPAVGGSWMVPADTVDAGDFAEIQRLCAEAVAAQRLSAERRIQREGAQSGWQPADPAAADECRYDALALGEVMLRLDPGEFGSAPHGTSPPGVVASTTWSVA